VTATSSTNSLAQALADLPVKLRVHELAKRAGVTSKDVILALAAVGVVVGSAASSVSGTDATAFLTALLGSTDSPPAQPAAPVDTPDLVDAVARSAPEQDPGFFAAPLFLPPAEPKPARRRRSTKAADTTGPVAPTLPEAAVESAPAEYVAELEAEPSSAAEAVESGPSRSSRRRRGRSGGRGRAGSTDEQQDEEDVVAAGVVAPSVSDEQQDSTGSDVLDADPDGAAEDEDGARRRRRRGRRGRGRAAEGQEESEADGDQSDEPSSEPAHGDGRSNPDGERDDESGEDDDSGQRTPSSRRRRRRRAGGGADNTSDEPNREDDPDNTVVHVREPRTTSDKTPVGTGTSEVQGIRGSTRLEAKRQRRREGRGSRSRPQILTEAEFLARRESVERVMAVRQRGDLAQVALLEDGVLVEHFVSQAGSESLMGNIYLGKVQNVLPSMEAAFVDIGKGRNAVLYAGEVNWDAAGLNGKARRIEIALSGGDTMLVQVSKDPVGHKGARLTTQISLPGRFLVYVPGGGATGISRKLPDTERKRLKSILDRIVPEDAGVIIRTAAEGVAEEELARDVERLKSQWEEISRQAEKKSNAPLLLSAEPDTLIKVVRDLFNSDITRLVLDGDRAYEPVAAYIEAVAPELSDRVSRYDGPNDVFTAYRIDEQIAKALERKVYLPSGGSLVIDRTEAMTVVDVNTGKYTGSGGNLEETVTKNNLEAAEEVVRQLRLRDIGGIIVVDFIDMVLESNRELVMRRLTECLGRDRTRHQVAEVTSLGLIQMTRKKMGTGLVEAFSEPCPHCQGRGIILHDVPVQDHSGGNAGGDNRAQDNGDNESRGTRNRRARGRQDAPAVELAAPKIVAAPVRPPDPRGPKPPTRGGEDTQESQPGPEIADTSRNDEPGTSVRSSGRAVPLTAGDDASFNAPRSRDASDAVSAVFAALDAQVAAQSSALETPPAITAATDRAATDTSGEPLTGGRRRGRRAAGRPAGAPSTAEVPAVVASETPDTAESIRESAGAAQVRVPDEADDASTAVKAHDVPVPDAEAEKEPEQRRAPARRRGGRAAGAAVPAAAPEPIPVPEKVLTEPAVALISAPTANGSVSVGPAPEGSSNERAAAAPRRRRAASRPAGPAAAPAAVEAPVS
jgi:ribonuclease E